VFLPVLAVGAVVAGGGQSVLADVRAATDRFHDVSAAEAAGYAPFYVCTDENGDAGAMGQRRFIAPSGAAALPRCRGAGLSGARRPPRAGSVTDGRRG
jgi:hypothetical protein